VVGVPTVVDTLNQETSGGSANSGGEDSLLTLPTSNISMTGVVVVTAFHHCRMMGCTIFEHVCLFNTTGKQNSKFDHAILQRHGGRFRRVFYRSLTTVDPSSAHIGKMRLFASYLA
jgi:hypothetical protein